MTTTVDEVQTIMRIVDRAIAQVHFDGPINSEAKSFIREMLACEIIAVHRKIVPLRLDEWLAADTSNFMHDVAGIHRHIVFDENLEHPTLARCFMPRFAMVKH
jgi:hypothetical protein